MSDFFTPPPAREPEPEYRQPDWLGPPENELAMVTEWSAQGVELTRSELDADSLLEAAGQSEVLWPGGGARPGGGFVSSQRIG